VKPFFVLNSSVLRDTMSESKSQIEKCKVLVVEDFPLVRDSLISLIESGLGFEVCGHAARKCMMLF
jgi:hypothetical protein